MISIEKCPDYSTENLRAALHQTFENLGGIRNWVRPCMLVVLKPNLVSKHVPGDAATTHPALIKVLTLMLKDAGAEVLLAESPFGKYTRTALRDLYRVCGMRAVADETGLILNENLEDVEVSNPKGMLLKKVKLLKPLVEAELVINLPKLKTHEQMVYTGAIKNMFGSVAGQQKLDLHLRMPGYQDFAHALIDIYLAAGPALTIMDAITGMDGPGPTAGNAREIGLILAGGNGFELDFTALEIVSGDYRKVPMLKNAVERGLCPAHMEDVEIRGATVQSVRLKDFVLPQANSMKVIRLFEKGPLKIVFDFLRPKPVFMRKSCVACRECEKYCPARVITMETGKPAVDLSKCIRCFCCQEICPAKAIQIKRLFLSNVLTKK